MIRLSLEVAVRFQLIASLIALEKKKIENTYKEYLLILLL
jgi:hypothetical protein